MVVNISVVDSDEDIFMVEAGGDGITSGEVGGCPVVAVNGGAEGGGVIKLEGEGSLGTGGSRCDEGRGEDVEAEGLGGGLRVELRPCRWASRCPRDVAMLRGGFLLMSLQVRRGRDDRKPFLTAFMSVEVEGEQRERTTYST